MLQLNGKKAKALYLNGKLVLLMWLNGKKIYYLEKEPVGTFSITSITANDIPAKGGTISKCTVNYVYNGTAGSMEYNLNSSVTGLNLLDTLTNRTLKSTQTITVTYQGLTDSKEVKIYQLENKVTSITAQTSDSSSYNVTYDTTAQAREDKLTPTKHGGVKLIYTSEKQVDYNTSSVNANTIGTLNWSRLYTTSETWIRVSNASTGELIISSRGAVAGDLRTGYISSKMTVTYTAPTAFGGGTLTDYITHNNIPVKQAANRANASFGDISLTVNSVSDVTAGSGTSSVPTFSFTQIPYYTSGAPGTTISGSNSNLNGATVYYGKSSNPTSTSSSSCQYTVTSLGTTPKNKESLGYAYIKVSWHDQSKEGSTQVYRLANSVTWNNPVISHTTPIFMNSYPTEKTLSPTITQSGTWTSGSPASNTSATYTYKVKTAVSGFSLNASTVSVTNNTSTSARNGFVVTITATGSGSQSATKDVTYNQPAGLKMYDTPTITGYSYTNFTAKGATGVAPTVTYSQVWTWNGVANSGGTLTSEGTLTYSTTGTLPTGFSVASTFSTDGKVTWIGRGTVQGDARDAKSNLLVKVTMNSKPSNLFTCTSCLLAKNEITITKSNHYVDGGTVFEVLNLSGNNIYTNSTTYINTSSGSTMYFISLSRKGQTYEEFSSDSKKYYESLTSTTVKDANFYWYEKLTNYTCSTNNSDMISIDSGFYSFSGSALHNTKQITINNYTNTSDDRTGTVTVNAGTLGTFTAQFKLEKASPSAVYYTILLSSTTKKYRVYNLTNDVVYVKKASSDTTYETVNPGGYYLFMSFNNTLYSPVYSLNTNFNPFLQATSKNSVIWNLNGHGSWKSASNTETDNTKVSIITGSSINTLTTSDITAETGYTLLGWSTSSTATTATYVPGNSYSGNSTTLYAIWKAPNPTHTVTWNANGGYFKNNTSITVMTESELHTGDGTSYNIPQRNGYEFIGWSFNSSATSVDWNYTDLDTELEYPWNESKTLYAVWKYKEEDVYLIKCSGKYLINNSGTVGFYNSALKGKQTGYNSTDADLYENDVVTAFEIPENLEPVWVIRPVQNNDYYIYNKLYNKYLCVLSGGMTSLTSTPTLFTITTGATYSTLTDKTTNKEVKFNGSNLITLISLNLSVSLAITLFSNMVAIFTQSTDVLNLHMAETKVIRYLCSNRYEGNGTYSFFGFVGEIFKYDQLPLSLYYEYFYLQYIKINNTDVLDAPHFFYSLGSQLFDINSWDDNVISKEDYINGNAQNHYPDGTSWAGDLITYAADLKTNSLLSFPGGSFNYEDFISNLDSYEIARVAIMLQISITVSMNLYLPSITNKIRCEKFINSSNYGTDIYSRFINSKDTNFLDTLRSTKSVTLNDVERAATKMKNYLESLI